MKLNIDCIRDILIYLEDSLTGINYGNQVKFNSVDILQISQFFDTKYDNVTIWYSIKMLTECGYVYSDIHKDNQGYLAFANVTGLTYTGHQFLNSIKPEPIWGKTKSVIEKIGSHTLNFIEQTAQMVAIESAKQAITIIMEPKK